MGEKIAGMAIGLPLSSCQDWITEAFHSYKEPFEDVFYIGDIVTEKEDHKMKEDLLKAIESHVKKNHLFSKVAICEVFRKEHPNENKKLEDFLNRQGYQKHEEIKSTFFWKDVDQNKKTEKTLIYWIKNLK